MDLRSRRSRRLDPGLKWANAHTSSDFNLEEDGDIERAIALSRTYNVPIAAASVYVGACDREDRNYGRFMIEQAARLAQAAPDGRLILRILGGDLWARARSLPGRWQDIRRALRDESLESVLLWEGVARDCERKTGKTVILGLEIYHGHYLSDLNDVHHLCQGVKEIGWNYLGFIDDPANRFIASEGDLLGAVDFARMVKAWGGRILSYHVKDVRYVSPWSQFYPQFMQQIGEPVFVCGLHKYEWSPLGKGEVDLHQTLIAAQRFSSPPHDWCMISTEYVAASQNEQEAASILGSYARLLEGSLNPTS